MKKLLLAALSLLVGIVIVVSCNQKETQLPNENLCSPDKTFQVAKSKEALIKIIAHNTNQQNISISTIKYHKFSVNNTDIWAAEVIYRTDNKTEENIIISNQYLNVTAEQLYIKGDSENIHNETISKNSSRISSDDGGGSTTITYKCSKSGNCKSCQVVASGKTITCSCSSCTMVVTVTVVDESGDTLNP